MRCVLDTNVWVSALLSPGSKPRLAADRARNQGAILLSYAALAELVQVISRPRFRRYLDEEDIHRFLAALTHEAQWVNIDVEISVCREPKDDMFLSLAASGKATHIVTGDADLLALHPFRGVQILNPELFLKLPDEVL